MWAEPPPPAGVSAPTVLVADVLTGTILYERGEDVKIPPASLAKLMTLYLSFSDEEAGLYADSTQIRVGSETSAKAMRYGSSVMGLTAGDIVSVRTLRMGAAVASAGDAAWTLALHSSGSSEAFVKKMNAAVLDMGMSSTHFVDPDGWSSLSVTSGRDQMKLTLNYINRYPQALSELHARPALRYSEKDVIAERKLIKNTNLLIGKYEGADGLKTGTIPSAGFHFVATAHRGGTRFAAVVMGIKPISYRKGLEQRAEEAALLLDWAFMNFYTYVFQLSPIEPVKVWHGEQTSVKGLLEKPPSPATLPVRYRGRIKSVFSLEDDMEAPVKKGEAIGTIRWYADGHMLRESAIVTASDVRRKWKIKDAWKRFLEKINRLIEAGSVLETSS